MFFQQLTKCPCSYMISEACYAHQNTLNRTQSWNIHLQWCDCNVYHDITASCMIFRREPDAFPEILITDCAITRHQFWKRVLVSQTQYTDLQASVHKLRVVKKVETAVRLLQATSWWSHTFWSEATFNNISMMTYWIPSQLLLSSTNHPHMKWWQVEEVWSLQDSRHTEACLPELKTSASSTSFILFCTNG